MEPACYSCVSPTEHPDQSNYMRILERIVISFSVQHEEIAGANDVFSRCLMDDDAKYALQLPEGRSKNLLAQLCSRLERVTIHESEEVRMVTKIRQDGRVGPLTSDTTLSAIFDKMLGREYYTISQPLKLFAGEFYRVQRESINLSSLIDSEGQASHAALQLYKSSKLLNDYLLVLAIPTPQRFAEELKKLDTQLKQQLSDDAMAMNVIDRRIIRQIKLLIDSTKKNLCSFPTPNKRKRSEETKHDSPDHQFTQPEAKDDGPSQSESDGDPHECIKPEPDHQLPNPKPVSPRYNHETEQHQLFDNRETEQLQLCQQPIEPIELPTVKIMAHIHNHQYNNEMVYEQVMNSGGQERSSSERS